MLWMDMCIPLNNMVYWAIFIALVISGAVKLLFTKLQKDSGNKIITNISIIIGVFAVLFLALTREAYAVIVSVLLLGIKGILFSAMRR